MPSPEDRAYLSSRALEERRIAGETTDRSAALIHLQLADEYEARAADMTADKVALRVVREGPAEVNHGRVSDSTPEAQSASA